MNSEDLAATEL